VVLLGRVSTALSDLPWRERSSHVWLRDAVLRAAASAFKPVTIPQ
jgi:hypothetical protein